MLRFTLAAILALSVSPALAHDPASPASAHVLSVPEGLRPRRSLRWTGFTPLLTPATGTPRWRC